MEACQLPGSLIGKPPLEYFCPTSVAILAGPESCNRGLTKILQCGFGHFRHRGWHRCFDWGLTVTEILQIKNAARLFLEWKTQLDFLIVYLGTTFVSPFLNFSSPFNVVVWFAFTFQSCTHIHRPCINQAHHRHAYIHTYIVNVHACIHTFINLNRLFWGISGLGVYNSISNSNFTLTSNSSYHFQHLFNNSGSEGLLATKWLVANTHTTYSHTNSRYTHESHACMWGCSDISNISNGRLCACVHACVLASWVSNGN